MQAHILSSTSRVGSRGQYIVLLKVYGVMFHSKLKRMEHKTPAPAYSLSLYTPSTPGLGQKSKTFFLLKLYTFLLNLALKIS